MVIAWSVFVLILAALLMVISVANLRWMLYAWSSPEAHVSVGFASVTDKATLSFSLILPCRDEPEVVMRATIDRLLAQRHSDFEIIISVGHDDLPTIEIAQRIAREDPRIDVSINYEPRKNKPKQLNSSLRDCSKDIVGVVDAESLTRPELLRGVEATFRATGADVVQGAVQLINHRDRWFTLRNCLEYRTWFRSRLHAYSQSGFVPLGGNTVFVRRDLLISVGGWDAECLAEDCDLGVRLSVLGKRIVCAYDRELTTVEEAPVTVTAFLKQRTRWTLGFYQVIAKGDWRKLATRRERLGAWWTLVQQFAMILTGLALPISVITAFWPGLPILVVLLAFVPAVTTMLTIAFEGLILRELGSDLGLKVSLRDYTVLTLSLPFYQLLLATAALRAMWKFVTKEFSWEKTAHTGSHVVIDLRDGHVANDTAAVA